MDDSEAVKWLQAAVEQGHVKAMIDPDVVEPHHSQPWGPPTA